MKKEGMPAYIYPQWLTAKWKLIEKLSDPMRRKSIDEVVDSFFRSHVFEIGSEYSFNPCEWEQMYDNKDFHDQITKRLLYSIAEEIYRKGCYISDTETKAPSIYSGSVTTRTVRVLVFAAPALTGPGTREAHDLSKS